MPARPSIGCNLCRATARVGLPARIEIHGPPPREAAAVVAAVEQFVADTAPAAEPAATTTNPWQQAALVEGVSAKQAFGPARRTGWRW